MKNIKWCAIQPLTGGMYLGAEKSIGHPAEFILSFPSIGDPKIKDDKVISAGNEYNLMTYLKKVNRNPEYRVIQRDMFQYDDDMNPEIRPHNLWSLDPDKKLDYSNMDVCVAVPVCSGLSTATIGKEEAKNTRNCNMLWISKYVLSVIKPKIYIFENAPTFMGTRGDYIRRELEYMALCLGYSINYYKTDTLYHDNCQTRKRTFIIFYNKPFAPRMEFESITTNYDEYFARIPDDATQKETLSLEDINSVNYYCIEYVKNKFGNEWRKNVDYDLWKYLVKNDLFDEVDNYTHDNELGKENHRKFLTHFINHYKYKTSIGRGVYHALPNILYDHKPIPAVMFKMVQSIIHPYEDRPLNIRELLHLMGMPHDYELQGDVMKEYPKIGQNVPVRTAYWIVSEAMRAYDRDNDLKNTKRVRYFNNIKKKEEPYSY